LPSPPVSARPGRWIPANRPTPLTDLILRDAADRQTAPATAPADLSRPWVVGETKVVASSGMYVNGRIVTVDEVLDAARMELAALATSAGSEEVFRAKARPILAEQLRRRRDELLLLTEAERRLSDEQKKLIDERVEQRMRNRLAEASGSRTRLIRELAGEGTTPQELRRAYREELMIKTYLRSMFMPAISINRRGLMEYYRRHLRDFMQPKKVQMQLIAAPFRAFGNPDSPAARERARRQIERARQALREGRDFAEVAREFSKGVKASEGGLWQAMPMGSFREVRVEEAAFQLAEGQVSDVIETETGYYIVKAARVYQARSRSFEEAQKEIEEILRNEQFRRLSEEYYARVQERATVEYPREVLQQLVEAAVQRYWRR